MVATQARVVLWRKIRMGLIAGDAVFRARLGFWTTTGTRSSLRDWSCGGACPTTALAVSASSLGARPISELGRK